MTATPSMGLIPLWPLTHNLTSDRVVANTDADAGNLQDSHPEFVPDPLEKRIKIGSHRC